MPYYTALSVFTAPNVTLTFAVTIYRTTHQVRNNVLNPYFQVIYTIFSALPFTRVSSQHKTDIKATNSYVEKNLFLCWWANLFTTVPILERRWYQRETVLEFPKGGYCHAKSGGNSNIRKFERGMRKDICFKIQRRVSYLEQTILTGTI